MPPKTQPYVIVGRGNTNFDDVGFMHLTHERHVIRQRGETKAVCGADVSGADWTPIQQRSPTCERCQNWIRQQSVDAAKLRRWMSAQA